MYNYKIAIFGASGTGKTTLAKLISEKYNIPYLKKLSPGIYKEIFENEKDPLSDKTKNSLFILSHCICRMHQQLETINYVADRSILDSIMYIMLDFDYSFKSEILKFLKYNLEREPYDLLIFVPKEFELSATETKPRLSEEHRNREDELAKTIYEEFSKSKISKRYIKVHGSIDERMKKISEVILEISEQRVNKKDEEQL